MHYYLIYLLIGLLIGTISTLLGVGGGWLVTPALIQMGLPVVEAVPTSLAQMTGTSLFSLRQHIKNNSFDKKLIFWGGLPLVFGILIAKLVINQLSKLNLVDPVVDSAYLLLLSYTAYSTFKKLRKTKKNTLHIRSVSKIPLVFLCFFTGVISGVMGVGGGFLLVPIFHNYLSVPLKISVGSALGCIFLSSFVATIQYLPSSLILWNCIPYILIGSFIGSHLGIYLHKRVNEKIILKTFIGLLVIIASTVLIRVLKIEKPTQQALRSPQILEVDTSKPSSK